MAGLRRHRSWHEDFARNFFKLFSRSKSLEQEKTDIEPENGEEHEDDNAYGELGKDESLVTAEPKLPTAPGSQTLEHTDQDGAVEGDGAPDGEGVARGNAERDPAPITPPVAEPSSPAPPADGFLRRLGSLFLFARSEPGGGERQSHPSAEAQGSGGAEHADPEARLGGVRDVEGGERTTSLRPQEPSHSSKPCNSSELSRSVAAPEVKDTLQPEEGIQDTQLQVEAETEEDGDEEAESPLVEKEEERRRALACPPVVTHGTYRGLREVRRMRRQEVHLHSPISEGEEGPRGSGAGLPSRDEEEMSAVISPTGSREGRACDGGSWPSDVTLLQVGSGHASPVQAGSSPACPNAHSPVEAEGTGNTGAEWHALRTQNQTRTQPVGLEPDLASTNDDVCTGEKGPDWPAVCLDTSVETQGGQPVPSGRETPHLEAVSPCESHAPSQSSDTLLFPLTVGAQKTYVRLSNTDTAANLNECSADANTASDALDGFGSMEVISGSQQGGRGHEESHAPCASSGAEISGRTARWPELVLGDGAAQLGPPEEQPGLEEEMLHVESARTVDNILRNALAALEAIDASEREQAALSSDELTERAEALVLPGDAAEGAASLQRALQERLHAQADGSSQPGPSDKLLGGQARADGSRSTPSSGYESIAGSDTDIQSSVGVSADVTSASGPIAPEQEARERAGIGCRTHDRQPYTEGGCVCQKDGRGSLHGTALLLGANLEEGEGTVGPEANNELLSQYALNESNISHKINRTSVQSAISESLSGVHREQVQCILEEHEDSVTQRENDAGPQYAAKDNPESNKHDQALGLDSGASPIISKNKDLRQLESISERLSLIRVENHDSKQPDLRYEVRDPSDEEDQLTPPASQSPVDGEGLEKPKLPSQDLQGHTRESSDRHSGEESSFVLVQTYLASVVEDLPDSETGERESVPVGAGPIRLLGSDALVSCGTANSFLCSITLDQSEAREPESLAGFGVERAGSRPAAFSSTARALPDLPGVSGRLQAGEPHHGPSGFAVISEEEETDAVFVNDTGPLLSPGARRARAYPFSLSPIYEEDSGREDCSREEALHVPPATGEEQRSAEQQASSILSLLQSVSERLLSSALDGPEDAQDTPEEAERDEEGKLGEAGEAEGASWPPRAPRPLWERYGNDSDAAEDESALLPHRLLLGACVSGAKAACEEGRLLNSNTEQDSSGAEHAQEQETHSQSPQDSVLMTVDTPFYHYLKSGIVPELDIEQPLLCHSEGGLMSTTVKEMGIFRKASPRPTLLHISEDLTDGGRVREVRGDVEDANQILFPHGATIRALRGCWVLYVEPGFRGHSNLLEEGETVRSGSESRESGPSAPLLVGSIRRAVKDDSIPEIHLHLDRTPEREPEVLHSEADCVDERSPVRLSDLRVGSGCWLVYDGAGFTGNRTLLEVGGSSTPLAHDSPVSCVRSLRPLRMGGLRVKRPLDPEMVVYEKPLFQGQWRKLLENTPRLGDGLAQIGSLRVTGGVWVGYSCENYVGQQCVLEEGELTNCTALFSGPELTLKSCRFLQADFIEPAVCLRSSGKQLEILDSDMADLQPTAMTQEPDAIHVRSGVWVAYSGRSYTGQQSVLERGQHSGTLDWGSGQSSPLSIRPVRKLRAYSQPGFAGESRDFESEVVDCAALCPASFRVILGSWLLHDEEGYHGNQFVLGEGLYPNLVSCGSSSTAIRSFSPIPYMGGIRVRPLQRASDVAAGQASVHAGRRAYLHVRSRALRTALTAETTPGPSSPAKLSLRPADRALDAQHWVYAQSLLRSRVDKSCLSVIGAKASVGARVALWTEHGRTHQKWSLNENGTISSHLNRNLVLDQRGGSGIDRDHLILSEFCAGKASQYWDIEAL
ncbi:hypothetical protein P4O66_005656 [Electrophorus voltai]|uniref:Beta/gamma crystallin 'Greek key' domain-containing protein n=1 Tax=Electrophorus voltai TaxID=2609070 RepID=A0AAD9E112_9TELE|nr:hypothetical protein P4O66_005656 [Electrophorus voltai]